MTTLPKRITMAWIDRIEDKDLLTMAHKAILEKQDAMIPANDNCSGYMESDQYRSLEDRAYAIEQKMW